MKVKRASPVSILSRSNGLVCISGILFCIAGTYINPVISLFCLSPSFLALSGKSAKTGFRLGILFGLIAGGVMLFWMNEGVALFTNGHSSYGFLSYLLCLLITVIHFGFIFFVVAWIQKRASWFNILAVPAAWVIFEYIHYYLLSVVAWMGFYAGYTSLKNDWLIQWASLGGFYILSFITVLINYLLYLCIQTRSRKLVIGSAGALIFMHLGGYLILKEFERNEYPSEPLSAVIINQNYPPDTKWDETTGDGLIKNLLTQNARALKMKPDLILWCESVVPWTYRDDDDLINAIAAATLPGNTTHVMGITTDYDEELVYNSAYALNFRTGSKERYDKTYLIPLAEEASSFLRLPFMGNTGYHIKAGAKDQQPFQVKRGKAGIVICNESMISSAAANMVRKGAEFFLVPGNDAWFFEGTLLLNQHFYSCRLRAVETRKDFVVNYNMGYSGKIDATGRVDVMIPCNGPVLEKVNINGNKYKSGFLTYPNFFIVFIVFIGLAKIFFKI